MDRSLRRSMSVLICPALLSTALVAFPLPSVGSAQALAGLDRYIEHVREDWQNVGLAVAVVEGHDVIYLRGFGVKEFGKGARIDARTLFEVGSTSKAFTTAALGILADEGKIRWDDPVIHYLPGFGLPDPWLTRNLTIRDTVIHSSGITDSRFSSLGNMDLDAAIRQLRSITPAASFRASFRYSNLMYAVAGKIIEEASGATWHEFVKTRLLRPLGMNRSGTSAYEFWDAKYVAPTFMGEAPAGTPTAKAARDANVAMPHAWDDKGSMRVLPWISYDNKAAAGSIVSSGEDMARWLIFNLNEGRFEGRQLLTPGTLRELHTPQNHYAPSDFPFEGKGRGYAMGWLVAEYRGNVHLSHGGGIIGFPAHVAMLPERKIGVAVLSNGPQGAMFHQAIELEIFDRLLGASRRDWNEEFLVRAQAAKQVAQRAEEELRKGRLSDAPPLPVERYVGVYENRDEQTGRLKIHVANEQLTLSFEGAGAFSAPLQHWHRDLFRLQANPGVTDSVSHFGHEFVFFTIDTTGQVTSLRAFDVTFKRIREPGDTSPLR